MKRFDAIYKDDKKNNYMLKDGEIHATEVRFDIIAKSEERALELIKQEGKNPQDFELEETSGFKDLRGRYFTEEIRDARI